MFLQKLLNMHYFKAWAKHTKMNISWAIKQESTHFKGLKPTAYFPGLKQNETRSQ